MFVPEEKTLRSKKLMAALDDVNKKMGRGVMRFVASGQKAKEDKANWRMNQQRKSKCLTTNWDELLEVKAD